jgi:anti-sigma regulatory factor (Ser/Thr protein kinase)
MHLIVPAQRAEKRVAFPTGRILTSRQGVDPGMPPSTEGPALAASLCVAGGLTAPRAARHAVMACLRDRVTTRLAADAGLVVSELVTNSVCHADVGPEETIGVDLLLFDDRLRIVVADSGSEQLPRLEQPGEWSPSGRGLRVVEAVATSWGVARDGAGETRVWCELPVSINDD